MAYIKKIWNDYPDTTTPILASDMNNIENGIETLDIAYSGLLNFFYPVGTIYETTSSDLDTTTKMANHFGGTWEVYGAGRVLVGKSADTEFDTIGETGGAKTHNLQIAEIPGHNHILYAGAGGTTTFGPFIAKDNGNTGASPTTGYDTVTGINGGGQAHNNLQPYIVVYRYRRVS